MALDRKRAEEKTPEGPAEEWTQVHSCSVIWPVIGGVYTVVIEGFFGLLGLGGLIALSLNLLWLAGIRFWPNDADLHRIADDLGREPLGQQILIAVVLLLVGGGATGAIAWWGLKGAWAGFLDIVMPAAIYQGNLQSLQVQRHLDTIHGGGWSDWMLTVQGRAWKIQRIQSNKWRFEKEFTPCKEIRVKYSRGTGVITRLWVRSDTTHHQLAGGKF